MSGRARLALSAAAATLMASCAMLPLVDGPTWLVLSALLVAVQAGVGIAARRIPLPRSLTLPAQLLVTLVLLTLVFARGAALGGLVPGPRAFLRFGELLGQGSDDVSHYAIPAPLTDGIRLLLVGGVLLVHLLVDTLAVTFRRAAPAGLPLLALYSVAAGLSDGGADWLWFLVAAAGYLMLLLAEGRERLAQWGRVFGGTPRAGAPAGAVTAPARTGRRIGVLALGVALVVPLALPTLHGGLLGEAGSGVGAGNGRGGTISAVNPLVSLRDSLNVDDDRQVLSLRPSTGEVPDMYVRIVSLDDFDGTDWKPSQRHIGAVPGNFPEPVGLSEDVKRSTLRTVITAADWYAQDWLPMPYPPSGVRIDGNWRYEPVGMTLVGDHGQTTRGKTYQVTSLDLRPTAKQLAGAPKPPAALEREYTRVPARLPDVVARTAEEVTSGARNHYEEAVRLQDWFSVDGGFRYDTEVQVGRGANAIANFLKRKEGFCVHFSFAMAAMARTLGIPARVAVGFAPGTPQGDGSVSVSLKDAHAWPELYFQGVGWTRFEPTPTRGTTPAYTQPDAPSSARPDRELPSRGATREPSAAATRGEDCATPPRSGACTGPSAAVAAPGGGGGPSGGLWAALIVLGGLALVVLPLSPMLWRTRVRARRLDGHSPDPAERTQAAWRELTDSAWDFGVAPDDSLTPRGSAARIVRLGRLDGEAEAAVHRVAAALEQVLYAREPRPAPDLARDVRRMVAALAVPVTRATRLRALFAPRSARRLLWAADARRAALRARVASLRPVRRDAPGQQG
ncbi:transglutaminase TgpA family protein [Streptomyces sp. DT195]|uniref:transglutaminase TgpA family protein n=1 Tax=Streptomyces sp. DT195 TaxID=3393419 RepID=UPI003CF200DE